MNQKTMRKQTRNRRMEKRIRNKKKGRVKKIRVNN